jgi:aspartyl aminopeptidase
MLPLYVLFDNEEVGSATRNGADSTFLTDTLSRILGGIGITGEAAQAITANSFLVSADNAHARHPNHPELADPMHAPHINGGVVVKYNANRRYVTDGTSAAVFEEICHRAGVATQSYCNRADMPGGSTLGSIAETHLSIHAVDIGLPQLAMHAATETAGAEDLKEMVKALRAFYGTNLKITNTTVEIL